MENKQAIVSVRNVTKSFAGVKALNKVSIDLLPGKVHGLMGANGAGKSTLIKVLAGVHMPNDGEVYVLGSKVNINNPQESASLGLTFIHQELSLVENFNVTQNITLGLKKENKLGFIDWKATNAKLKNVIEKIGFNKPLHTLVRDLSVADKWLVSIARALFQDTKLIAMDEPTASLSQSEVEMLFSVIHDLTAEGVGVVYVSHRLDEVMEICDEVTVFKDGVKVMYKSTSELTKEELITSIAGGKVEAIQANTALISGEVIMEAKRVSDGSKVRDVSFTLHKGEVLGITGLVGAGRTELTKILFGSSKCTKGSMSLYSKQYSPKNPEDAVKNGIVIVPEERRSEGLITNKSVGFNLNLPNLYLTKTHGRFSLLSQKKADDISRDIIDKLLIKTTGPDQQVLSLSGGNQQKVVIGKWLKRNPKIVIMDEPTRGVDVGARAEIYKLIRKMANDGVSFIIVSSDIDELPGLCDRTIVMANGLVTGELVGDQIVKESMLRLSYVQG